ncbi:MAG: cellulase family glycosylhydrolase [Bryobacterales bacterium]|nr:cellulase family glycosylhydrolase [Bryobacterales bacterium]
MPSVTRRHFLAGAAGCGTALAMPKNAIPRWRGFNLLYYFQAMQWNGDSVPIPEDDFRMIAELGFDFVRIPMDYWYWVDPAWRQSKKLTPDGAVKINEAMLEGVDRIVEFGRKYSLHVSLNLHRAPGYCINNNEREPFSLWTEKAAEDAFLLHWQMLAKRYRASRSSEVSLNLLNEAPSPRPGFMSREDYRRVMTRATEAIRAIAPDRMVIIDGLSVGNEVVYEMMPTRVAQSVHAYYPGEISHYRAGWVDKRKDYPNPWWPAVKRDGSALISRDDLEKHYEQWGWLVRQGVGVHCGEAGCFNKTPHEVFLRWICDVLDILKSHQIGWALWNFRGSFGVVDSERDDADYGDFMGHKVDRKLLTLLQYH